MGNAKGTREERRAAAIARNNGIDKYATRDHERKLRAMARDLGPIEVLTLFAAGRTVEEYVEWKAKNDAHAK